MSARVVVCILAKTCYHSTACLVFLNWFVDDFVETGYLGRMFDQVGVSIIGVSIVGELFSVGCC